MELDPVLEVLRSVIDPELGINIVDLGLVRRVEVVDGELEIDLIMTSPMCPLGDLIMSDVARAVEPLLPSGGRPHVSLMDAPPWSAELMSPAARVHLGWGDP